jgi:hypothetical protein
VEQVETLGEMAMVVIVGHGGFLGEFRQEPAMPREPPVPVGAGSGLGAKCQFAYTRTSPPLRVVVVVVVARERMTAKQ